MSFKVGDRIVCISHAYGRIDLGDVGTIAAIDDGYCELEEIMSAGITYELTDFVHESVWNSPLRKALEEN